MLKGNKGEWSEVYALFKLLAEGKLTPGDRNLNKLTHLVLPIIRIIKNEIGVNFEYELKGDLVLINNGITEVSVPVGDFQQNAIRLFKLIKSSSGTFGDSEIETFMASFNSKKLKAKSSSKSDIQIHIHDARIGQTVDLGFSIKSELGGSSTLLNAGETTNFIYKVTGYNFSETEIRDINSINTKSKIKDRIIAIKDNGAALSFYDTNKEVFKDNLVLIDSLLPQILSEIVLNFYTSKNNSIQDLTKQVHLINPLNYSLKNNHLFYEYKIKKFLVEVALGMMPSKVWLGAYDATGGTLIVKANGDIICYHIYNRNHFEDYLFHQTRLETASSTKHNFGQLYQEKGEFFFKLNLQVRF